MTNAASVPPPHQSKRQSFVLPSNYLCWADLTAAGFFGNKKVRRRGARVRNAQNTMSPWSGSFGELYCVSVDKVSAAERLQHGTELGRALCQKSAKGIGPPVLDNILGSLYRFAIPIRPCGCSSL